jgi:hypothetical protein
MNNGQLSRDGRFRWSAPWRRWVPVRDPPLTALGPCPADCACLECKPRPKRVYRERDSLDDKQARLFWK